MVSSGEKKLKIIVSGGGTAGHIYPAVALVQTLETILGKENVDVLFVGAQGKMEMERVPELGYRIEALPIAGLQRKFSIKNLLLPIKIAKSLMSARSIIANFNPDIVVGFGGYASAPILKMAQSADIPTVLWEGNSYAGMANRVLAKGADVICVAYSGMERFFPAQKIVVTGNPIRGNFGAAQQNVGEALDYFGFGGERAVLLVTGGSLGARVLNDSVLAYIDQIAKEKQIDIIWQCGSYYYEELKPKVDALGSDNIHLAPFIKRMDLAYTLADLVVSRAGGSAIAELSLLGMAAIFVPSSGVAEDHQYKNAEALCTKGAAELVTDDKAKENLIPLALEIIADDKRLAKLRSSIKEFAYPDAALDIANIVLKNAGKDRQAIL